MRKTGKLDYIEMPAGQSGLKDVKAFYADAFGWSFTDYGPDYAAHSEGLDGGFYQGDEAKNAKPLPVLYSEDLEQTLIDVEKAGGKIVKPVFSFPGGRRFHFTDPSGNELAVWSEN
ncbi:MULTISPECIES: VOC family protein [Pseudochrobactrum]|uniref:Glyoxalase/fosfomycin resistance/dioxygenase domain-containing protein n=1 Tax=Pseudochrobactrum saccharolyticum TaxID=354352 RepID=A0A7W8AFY7_9HYPH|nr:MULTISPECIES: VOC family protein [Pseudochrobactrum]MBX8784976.1 VOC family protein [Ochrobactrum sp. GRS2]KAB0540110.1 VOC family protein [Pseudochrobactrum saccharolyticum]MBB5089598.1 hypothetical protein [Pseudochrobactrum saccharolyticum]MDP8251506.1 VOC family protein [Pseudochrobactrum saccharolyticum]QYM72661.1 VOC family protein [Pseudochrobactrum sp. Wa41.01b-1]